jgi:hypothetical protein
MSRNGATGHLAAFEEDFPKLRGGFRPERMFGQRSKTMPAGSLLSGAQKLADQAVAQIGHDWIFA